MTAYRPHDLPWWQLGVPTAGGDRVLDCWHPGARHRAAHVYHAVVTCSLCGTPRTTGFVWATLDRSTVLCGRCHEAHHATVAAVADVPVELDGQLSIDDELAGDVLAGSDSWPDPTP